MIFYNTSGQKVRAVVKRSNGLTDIVTIDPTSGPITTNDEDLFNAVERTEGLSKKEPKPRAVKKTAKKAEDKD